MLMTSCYIIDDEEASISLLTKFITKTPNFELIGSALNPLDALHQFLNGEVYADITFLDINMPEISGLDLANLIGKHTQIIFTTAHTQYGMEAFDRDAIDYIAKPFGYERFLKAITRLHKFKQHRIPDTSQKEAFFFIKNDVRGRLTRILIDEILYIESLANYISIHTFSQKHSAYLTLTETEEYLTSYDFVRVHKSAIVNSRNIKSIDGNKIMLSNGAYIIAGTSYKSSLSRRISKNLLASKRRN